MSRNCDNFDGVVSAPVLLDALPDATAVLDPVADVLAVNKSWQDFWNANSGEGRFGSRRWNYLEVCAASALRGSVDAELAAERIRAVLAKECEESQMEYNSSAPSVGPAPAVERWHLMRVTALAGASGPAVLVSHLDITQAKIAQRRASIGGRSQRDATVAAAAALSPRERQIVSQLRRGDRIPAIAASLFISQSTARTQLSSIFTKLGVSSQQQLIELLRRSEDEN